MHRRVAFGALLPALTLSACTPSFRPSPHYANVSKHLDVGGQVLFFADIDGELAAGADYLDQLIARVRKSQPDLKLDRFSARRLLEQLGLDQVLAVGLSSSRDGKIFHNQAFLEYGKKRRGLLLMTEAPPRELEVLRQAPGDVDVAFETDLKLKTLVDLLETIARDIADKEANELFARLDEPLPGSRRVSIRQLINHLDTRLVSVLRVDEKRSLRLPGSDKVPVPGFDVLVSLDNMGILFDAAAAQLRNLPTVTSATEGDMEWLELRFGVAGAPWLKPALAKNAKTGRLFLATSKSFVREYLASKKADKNALAQTADWKRASARFTPKANSVGYVSGAFLGKVGRFVQPLAKDDKEAQAGVDILLDLLPEPGIPLATECVSMPDGLYFASYATTSHKSTLFPTMAAGPIALGVAAAGISGYLKAATAAAAPKPSIAQIPRDDAEDEDPRDHDGSVLGAVEGRLRIPLGGPSHGAATPTVNIVELADFQCPYCSRAAVTMRELLAQYPDDVRLYFRNHPLAFHSDAALAAQAALAADAQGKFWPMHDQLFANQGSMKRADLEAYAKAIGLDMARFNVALDQGSYQKAVEDDAALAAKAGADGTPIFFINGRRLSGAQPLEKFKEIVDEEIATARQLMAHGTRRQDVYSKLMARAQEPRRPAPPRPTPVADASRDVYKVPLGHAPVRGGKAPKVTIVEFSDFQCPFCLRVVETLKQIEETYGADVQIAFKNNPLPFHNHAMPAALAAVAAQEQGKFWQMHDKMFANQQHLDRPNLEKLAAEVGLNMARFKAAMDSEKNQRRIKAEQDEAANFDARGTPTFFINGRKIAGAYPFESFKTVIDDEIKKADAKLKGGVTRKNLYAELTRNGLEKAAAPSPVQPQAGEPDAGTVYRADVTGAPVKGAQDALVTIVMFSDYQCPFCRRVEPTIDRILSDYKGEVRVAWRDLPLPFHPLAKGAAIAARAAGQQGKYWQMHDKLFGAEDGQVKLERADLERYATELGLNMKRFTAASESNDLLVAVEQDAAMASRLGVSGTPSFFINGKFFVGAQPYEKFKEKIDAELKNARRLVAKGTPRAKVYSVIMSGALTKVDRAE